MGPTAGGKTAFASALYESGQFELVSVDSVLVYRGLDIGSAKPTADEPPHHLIDLREFWETYSAGDFRADCQQVVAQILARGKTPLLVGGTQMYYKSLIELDPGLPEANAKLREQIRAEAKKEGWPALHAKLAQCDPATAARLHPNHSSRIERALEVFQLTGQPLSSFHARAPEPLFKLKSIMLIPEDRTWLHRRIEQRFEQMLAQGFEAELQRLMASVHFKPELTSMMSVGYRQGIEYLSGAIERDGFVEKGVAATRQLAKRQLTWLRSWPKLSPASIALDPQHASPAQVLEAFRRLS